MVHALEKASRLLQNGSKLIEAHDIPRSFLIAVRTAEKTVPAGRIQSHNKFEQLRQTDAALAAVVRNGMYIPEQEQILDYKIYVDSLDDFSEWLNKQWEGTYLSKKTSKTIDNMMRSGSEKTEIVICRSARMRRLGLG